MALTFNTSTFTDPINSLVTEVSKISTEVEKLGTSVRNDIMNEVNNTIPISEFLNVINGISNSLKNVVQNTLPNMTSTLNNMSGTVDGISGSLNSIDLVGLNKVINDPASCKTPICQILTTFESLMDLDQCDTETCKIVRSVKNIITSGSTEGCELGACQWIDDIMQIVQDPSTCDLPVCTMIRDAINKETIMGHITSWIDSLFEKFKLYVMIGVGAFLGIILLMFIMLIYLVFK